MAEKKGITVKIDEELHHQVKAEQEELGLTMAQYIEKILEEHFNPVEKEEVNEVKENQRTMALQLGETDFQRLKNYLAAHSGMT